MEAKSNLFGQLMADVKGAFEGGEMSTQQHATTPSTSSIVNSSSYSPLPGQELLVPEMSALAKVGIFLCICTVLYLLYLYWQNSFLTQQNSELSLKVSDFEKIVRKLKKKYEFEEDD